MRDKEKQLSLLSLSLCLSGWNRAALFFIHFITLKYLGVCLKPNPWSEALVQQKWRTLCWHCKRKPKDFKEFTCEQSCFLYLPAAATVSLCVLYFLFYFERLTSPAALITQFKPSFVSLPDCLYQRVVLFSGFCICFLCSPAWFLRTRVSSGWPADSGGRGGGECWVSAWREKLQVTLEVGRLCWTLARWLDDTTFE